MTQHEQLLQARGAEAVASDGNAIGTVQDIYLDRDTGAPEWAFVETGWFGGKGTFVPLTNAMWTGSELTVAYPKDKVEAAPTKDPEVELSQSEEASLYDHYGLDYSEQRSGTGLPEGEAGGAPRTATDDAMTRSEEEVAVGKTTQERGRARLKKYVVTDEVQQTVPVEREEVRLEREPVTEANIDQATEGPEISEDEHEVVLREEQPVVEKRTVPKERIRLSKETDTEEAQVSEQVRKEQIEPEGEVPR